MSKPMILGKLSSPHLSFPICKMGITLTSLLECLYSTLKKESTVGAKYFYHLTTTVVNSQPKSLLQILVKVQLLMQLVSPALETRIYFYRLFWWH